MKDLTIIIPVYNASKYLMDRFKTHIKPIYNSNIEFEIIYVNDGSSDNSLEVLKQIEKDNKHIKIITQDNQGSSIARNVAIDIAQGEYIQFLDSDDYIEINEIIQLLYQAKKNNLDLIGYRLDYVNDKNIKIGERQKQNIPHNKILTGEECLIQGYQPSSICVFLFKTKFLNYNNLRITPNITHMDVEFTTRVMLKAKKVMFLDIIAYHYMRHEGSITKPTSLKKLEHLLSDEIIVAHLIKQNITQGMNEGTKDAIIKNYNNVVWNLLWRFFINPNEVSLDFKKKSIKELKEKKLYPIKGNMKTTFQKISKVFFNLEKVYLYVLKKRRND